MSLAVTVWGSADFTVHILEWLERSGRKPVGVVSVSDRPAGRGLKERPTPVSSWAGFRPEIRLVKVDDLRQRATIERIGELGGDLGIVASFGKILPKSLLRLYPYGFINVHPSMLPELRGSAPIQRAIMRGYAKTGVTLAYLDEGIDSGDIIDQEEEEIRADDNAETLEWRLRELAVKLLERNLERLERVGKLSSRPQPEEGATYAPALRKEEFKINWENSRENIRNLVRALSPHPGAYTFFRGKRLRISRCEPIDLSPSSPGSIHVIGKDRIAVSAMDGCLELLELQPEGSRVMTAGEFIRGYHPADGMRLAGD